MAKWIECFSLVSICGLVCIVEFALDFLYVMACRTNLIDFALCLV